MQKGARIVHNVTSLSVLQFDLVESRIESIPHSNKCSAARAADLDSHFLLLSENIKNLQNTECTESTLGRQDSYVDTESAVAGLRAPVHCADSSILQLCTPRAKHKDVDFIAAACRFIVQRRDDTCQDNTLSQFTQNLALLRHARQDIAKRIQEAKCLRQEKGVQPVALCRALYTMLLFVDSVARMNADHALSCKEGVIVGSRQACLLAKLVLECCDAQDVPTQKLSSSVREDLACTIARLRKIVPVITPAQYNYEGYFDEWGGLHGFNTFCAITVRNFTKIMSNSMSSAGLEAGAMFPVASSIDSTFVFRRKQYELQQIPEYQQLLQAPSERNIKQVHSTEGTGMMPIMSMQQLHAALWFVRIIGMSTERKIVPSCVFSRVRAVLAGVLRGRADTNACADVCRLFRGDLGKLASTALLGTKEQGVFGCLQWNCESKQGELQMERQPGGQGKGHGGRREEEQGDQRERLPWSAVNRAYNRRDDADKHADARNTNPTAGLSIRKQLSDEAMAKLCVSLKL